MVYGRKRVYIEDIKDKKCNLSGNEICRVYIKNGNKLGKSKITDKEELLWKIAEYGVETEGIGVLRNYISRADNIVVHKSISAKQVRFLLNELVRNDYSNIYARKVDLRNMRKSKEEILLPERFLEYIDEVTRIYMPKWKEVEVYPDIIDKNCESDVTVVISKGTKVVKFKREKNHTGNLAINNVNEIRYYIHEKTKILGSVKGVEIVRYSR